MVPCLTKISTFKCFDKFISKKPKALYSRSNLYIIIDLLYVFENIGFYSKL